MNEDDLLILGTLIFLLIVGIALLAGVIVNDLFAPFPSIGGPLSAGVALIVFVFLLGKTTELIFG